MRKTIKNNKSNNNSKTKKINRGLVILNKRPKNCPIEVGLVPFEDEYSKTLSKNLVKSNAQIKKLFANELLAKFAPTKITPRNDFYNYVNYLWLKNVTLEKQQKYIVQVDDFRLAQDKVYGELDEIIVDYYKNNNNKLSVNLKNYYESAKLYNSKEDSRREITKIINEIDELRKNKKNVWKLLAMVAKDEMISFAAPFHWSINPDDKQSDVYRCNLDPHTFAFTDLDIYYDDHTDSAYKKKYIKRFNNTCRKLFDTVIGENSLNSEDVFNVAGDLFNVLGCTEITKNEKEYNRVTAAESLSKYGFDWEEFCKELGFKNTPKFFITSSLNYLKCCTKLLLDNWDSEKWRPYWIWIFARKLARITKEWRETPFEFYGEFQTGQEDIISEKSTVSVSLLMTVPFNTFLTNMYIEKHSDPKKLKYVEIMCNDLKKVFIRIIKRNNWLSPKTKKYALLKLKHLDFTIGNPKNLREDPLLDYGLCLRENLHKIYSWRHEQFLNLEGNKTIDIPMLDWAQYPAKMTGTQAYIVNASYTPSKNGIYINLGYIQKPFVDLDERGIEYNLAHLGFTISHEMSHSLDDWGSQYDYKGNLNDWWTETDKKKFKLIQKDVIKQYEEFAARDGVYFDASIGIGEDLADISGLAICDEYLRDFQRYHNDITLISSLSFEAFYVYYAFQMKQKVSKKALAAQLKTNPHPLDKYRTNVPLSRSEIFRSLYDVKKGDDMWWHNANTIW